MSAPHLIATLAVLFLAGSGCKKEEKTPDKPAEKAPADKPKADPPAAPTAGATTDPVVTAYDRIHDALAADKLDGVASAAGELAAAATAAKNGAPANVAPHLDGIVATAKPLETAADLAAARKQFGEVSRHVVALVQADPARAKGARVFECSMVEGGYNRWVQVGPAVENPYYGTQMLACGSAVE